MEELSPAAIERRLRTSLLGRPVLHYPRVSSTMDTARQAALQGAAEGTLVIAEKQTGGRGRRGRPWLSPSGSLALSLILRPPLAYLPRLVMASSLAVVRAIETFPPLRAGIKWPNDVLIGGKKACGILIESHLKADRVEFAIVGIGLNVNVDPAIFHNLPFPATSLSAELGSQLSRLEVLCRLLEVMEPLYLAIEQPELVEIWGQRLETLGQRVRIEGEETSVEGVAEGVGADGGLRLRLDDGTLRPVVVGDVSLHPI